MTDEQNETTRAPEPPAEPREGSAVEAPAKPENGAHAQDGPAWVPPAGAPSFDIGGGLTASWPFANLAAALARAQGAFEALRAGHTADVVGKSKDGRTIRYQYRYADLADALDACLPALSAEGLALVQAPAIRNGRTVTVITVLAHASGEYMRSAVTLEAGDSKPQSIGGIITYARRYALLAMVGLSPEDDDAQGQQRQQARRQERGSAPPPPSEDDEIASEIAAIPKAIAGVTTTSALAKVGARIGRLPKRDQEQFRAAYEAKKAEVSK
jgi:hypothetical protein